MRFALTKWYLDVVADDGRTAIAYWISLRAGPLQHTACGLLRAPSPPGGSRFTLRRTAPPVIGDHRGAWSCPPLDLHVTLQRHAAPVGTRLLDRADGSLDWTAEMPCGRVRLSSGRETIEGLGYAERLDMTIAPWTLPLTTLRWGRWLADAHAVVWIVWLGDHPVNLVWLDGILAPRAVVRPGAVDFGDGHRLDLADPAVITDATIGAQLAALPPLRRAVARVAGNHQTRWRARGTLRASPHDTPDDPTGWAIHEEVQWR